MTLIIKNRLVTDDAWQVIRADASGALPASAGLPAGPVLVPLAVWQTERATLLAERSAHALGVWLAPDQEPGELTGDFNKIALIGVDFPTFADGRGYSIAYLLRKRYGWKGELRALGDVLRDQLYYMKRCGFNAFAVRADQDIDQALAAFSESTQQYQGAVDEPEPLFRRRAAAAAPRLSI